MEPSTRVYHAAGTAQAAIILAPGAGAGQGHPFMVGYARGLARSGFDVVTFDFPYMREGRRVPDPAPVLEAAYQRAIEWTRQEHASAQRRLFIGGKSMGGRIATQVAAGDPTLPIAGLVLLGYPLHPPGRPEKRRDAHLPRLGRPALFIQGSRDTFGSPDELREALTTIVPTPTLHVVQGGDHSFKVSRAAQSAASAATDIDDAVQAIIADWMAGIVG